MSSISNQASAHSFCQESVSLVCSSAHLQLTNQEIGKSIYFFLRSWKEKKGKEDKTTDQNSIKQNWIVRQRELLKKFQKVSRHLCFSVSSGKLYEPEMKKHPSIKVSPKPTVFLETRALWFWMVTEQELNRQNTNVHWIFPPFANKPENRITLLHFPFHDVQAHARQAAIACSTPLRTALVTVLKEARKVHSSGKVW